ncbi:MAG: hypothetical protein HY052_07940 [Proteobacteria bacterium]|nr:hypothetical protein [Pseudomonadota bacterium]
MSKKSKEPPQRLFLLNTPEQVEAWYDGTLPGLYERDPDEFKKPYKKFGGKLGGDQEIFYLNGGCYRS